MPKTPFKRDKSPILGWKETFLAVPKNSLEPEFVFCCQNDSQRRLYLHSDDVTMMAVANWIHESSRGKMDKFTC